MLRRVRRLCWLLPLAFIAFGVLLVLLLRVVPPPTSAFMLASDVRPVRYTWVPWSKIAPTAALAVVAAEDQKFPDHWGFDFEAIDKAIDHNQKSKRIRGASTISQQTAKNLFLWSGRSYIRKGLELGDTLLLEGLWPKRRRLEAELNVAVLPNPVKLHADRPSDYVQERAADIEQQMQQLGTGYLAALR